MHVCCLISIKYEYEYDYRQGEKLRHNINNDIDTDVECGTLWIENMDSGRKIIM